MAHLGSVVRNMIWNLSCWVCRSENHPNHRWSWTSPNHKHQGSTPRVAFLVGCMKYTNISHSPSRGACSPHPRTPLLTGNLIGLQLTRLLFESPSQNGWQPAHAFNGFEWQPFCWVDRQLPSCFLRENGKQRHHSCLKIFCRWKNGK